MSNTIFFNASSTPDISVGETSNLGMSVSGGTITLHGADGTDLSASNPAYVTMPSVTAGQSKTYKITSNFSMTNTDMNGNLFGTTASVAWANQMPLYLYFMIDDAEETPIPAWGRVPHLAVSLGAANIGDPSAANADNQFSLYAWDDITEADYENNPVVCVGCARATKNSSDVWTFSALTEGLNGIDVFDEGTLFDYPKGHNGADASSFFISGAGTAPTFSGEVYSYQIYRDGQCRIYIHFSGDGGTAGSGAIPINIVVPFLHENAGISGSDTTGFGYGNLASVGGPPAGSTIRSFPIFAATDRDAFFVYTVDDHSEYQDFTAGTRIITASGTFQIERAS